VKARLGATLVISAVFTISNARGQPPEPEPLEAEPADEPEASEPPKAEVTREELRALTERVEGVERDLEATKKELLRTKKELAVTKKDLAREKKRARARKKPEPPFDLTLSGYLHVDAVPYRASSQDEIDASTGEPLNTERFYVRRARLRAAIERGIVGGDIELDGNTVEGPTARIVAGKLRVGWPPPGEESRWGLGASLGLMKIPFGHEVPEENLEQLFLERSTAAEAFFPGNYDAGVKVDAGYDAIVLQLAAMNGAPSGSQQFEGRDPAASLDLLARLSARFQPLDWLIFEDGGSALFGKGLHPGTPATKDVLVWRDVNENGLVDLTEVQAIAGSAATPSETYEHFAVGGHAVVGFDVPYLGRLALLGELIFAQNLDRALYIADPVAVGRDVRELGWLAGVRQEITEYAEIGVRFDRYDPDLDARDQQGVDIVPLDPQLSTWAFAAAARWRPARLIFEYDRRINRLGRTAAGLPTTRRDDSFMIRGEVIF
jgi:hypothetical protein